MKQILLLSILLLSTMVKADITTSRLIETNLSETPKAGEKMKPTTILCIPGNWKNRADIVQSIALNNQNEYLFAGEVLLNLKTNKGFKLEIFERDTQLVQAFTYAGKVNLVSKTFLEEIDKHNFVIYLSTETGNLDNAMALAEAGKAILKSGGTGVKVENTGIAFEKEQWTDTLKGKEIGSLFRLFVLNSLKDDAGNVFSCGMHNLGFKDVLIHGEDFQYSVELISIFNAYQIIDNPVLNEGETFSLSPDAPYYIINECYNPPYEGDENFGNPFGMWQLERSSVR